MTDREIVITGAGIVSPIGDSVSDFWQACVEGRSGLKKEREMDLGGLPCGWVGGILDDEVRARVKARSMTEGRSWGDALLSDVTDQALADAGLDGPLSRPAGLIWTKTAPLSGCSPQEYEDYMVEQIGLLRDFGGDRRAAIQHLRDKAAQKGKPSTYPEELSRRLGAPLFANRVEATCSGGLRAVAEGARLLRSGRADIAIVASAVSRRSHYVLSQYAQLRALSRWKGEPQQASMPFDQRRSGMVMAEAAAAIVLETREHARSRQREAAYAVVGGWGLAVDTAHVTAPQVGMVERVITSALTASGATVGEVDVVNAHGTSTKLNDLTEAQALRAVLGSHLPSVDVCAVKSITGHASAASGILEIICSGLTLCEQVVPPVVTCSEPDPECGVRTNLTAVRRPVKTLVKNSFGFGGQYASMVLRRPEEVRRQGDLPTRG